MLGSARPRTEPGAGGLRGDEDVSWIAQERLTPGLPSNRWIGAVILLAGVTFLVLATMGLSPIERTSAEEIYRSQDGPIQALDASLSPSFARILRAAAAATAVVATAFAARRLLHNEATSILAGGLLVLDPGFLVHGRLATPVAAATAAAVLSLALFLSPRREAHWAAGASLAIACFIDPVYLAWGVVLVFLVLARGHIYAAPQHAMTAGLQTLLIPAAGALAGMVAGGSLGPECYLPGRGRALLLMAPVDLGSRIFWHPNPILWFAGLGAVAWLGGMAAAAVLRDFRVQRLPGRIQVRLTNPLRREQGRALWILALVVIAPTPALWMPVLAIAIAAGVLELGRDNVRFGWAVGIGLVVLALAYTFRLWPLLIGASSGADVAQLTQTIPWASVHSC